MIGCDAHRLRGISTTRYNASMSTLRPIITLLTDFGDQDEYVGAMKGVILGIVPDAQIVDVTHQVKPQNILQAASILDKTYRYFPAHTLHIVVVDPGVGSARQPIALKATHGTFVAPDNGVLTHIRRQEPGSKAILLDRSEFWLPSPSNTSHGRDIFSPVGAHLAGGIAFDKMGSPLTAIIMLPMPPLVITTTSIKGEVIRIDHFGNALTNIAPLRWLDTHSLQFSGDDQPGSTDPIQIDIHKARITCGWHTVDAVHANYSQVPAGQALALVGSSGELEVAICQGNASDQLAIHVGSPVTLQFA